MSEHLLFLTGKLAKQSLEKVLSEMGADFQYTVHSLSLSVAALMTTKLIINRLKETYGANRIILPGRFRGDLDLLSEHFGIPVERGPEELKDLPSFFGMKAHTYDLAHYDIHIFAEIVDAPNLTPEQILTLAEDYRHDGANVIDLGFLPDTPFPQLNDCIALLKENDFLVSVDAHDPKMLIQASQAGADYLLSLKRETLWVADEVDATPILIPDTPQEIETLYECIDTLLAKKRAFIADPILDPIHCGFSESITRYHQLRKKYPEIEIMMGVGNLTELTHADTGGTNAILLGIASELQIRHILTTQVSEHCRKAVKEADIARRILYAARTHGVPPTSIDPALMALHERAPFPYNSDEIATLAAQIKDSGFRIQNTNDGIHIYNRDLHKTATNPFALYPDLQVNDDGGHAFYLGVELARAQIAWQLGKRYNQDEELDWGCAVEKQEKDLTQFKESGPTFDGKLKKAKPST